MRRAGQSLVELAICMPLLLLVVIGGTEVARIADAQAGLDAATAAGAAAAARAPDAVTAATRAQAAFAPVAGAHPLRNADLAIDTAGFARGASISAAGTATVELMVLGLAGLPDRVTLTSRATALAQPWRSR